MSFTIPVIDIDAEEAHIEVRRACEDIGFFYVSRAAVSSYDRAFEESKKFFEKETAFKLKAKCNSGNLGYTSFQDETLAPNLQKCGDTKEGYYLTREPDGEEEAMYQNVWPDEKALPEWKEVMKRYHAECTQYCERIVRLLTKALNLSVGNDLDRFIIQKPTALLRPLRYGKVISNPDEGVMGAGPHSDYGELISVGKTSLHFFIVRFFDNS
jgi:isopenicillin N synthase-like dioxygenase